MNIGSIRDHALMFWNRFWFRPASPLGMLAVRFILAANALWLVLAEQ